MNGEDTPAAFAAAPITAFHEKRTIVGVRSADARATRAPYRCVLARAGQETVKGPTASPCWNAENLGSGGGRHDGLR